MSDVDTRLRTLITTNAAVQRKIGDRMHLDKVPAKEQQNKPYVWYRRRSTGPSDTIDASAGDAPYQFDYDLEVIAPLASEAKEIADLIRLTANSGLGLNCYRGTFGDSTCQGIFVNDQEGGYEAFGIGESWGLSVVPLDVRVML
jgi:hypothetical protein